MLHSKPSNRAAYAICLFRCAPTRVNDRDASAGEGSREGKGQSRKRGKDTKSELQERGGDSQSLDRHSEKQRGEYNHRSLRAAISKKVHPCSCTAVVVKHACSAHQQQSHNQSAMKRGVKKSGSGMLKTCILAMTEKAPRSQTEIRRHSSSALQSSSIAMLLRANAP